MRRRILVDGTGIAVSAFAFGVVYGLAARQEGMSLVEGLAMSIIVFAGAAQFAAVGLLAQGVPWLGIVLLTALLNARHALYAASLAPWMQDRPRRQRALAAYLLTDEAFALVMPAFRALGRSDVATYVFAAAFTWIPWISATLLGMLGGQLLPEPTTIGLDVVFPAAMAGLAVALMVDRRSIAAAIIGIGVGVPVALAGGASVGILAGGLLGPLLAMLVPGRPSVGPVPRDRAADATEGLP
ncbi:MAG: AzlC family ABC transporter permease [Chloroflexi bacterium]|nr:AzlC family ABC transporter permease [Chloroflexota bacterium]